MSNNFKEFTPPAQQAAKDFKKIGMEDDLAPFCSAWNTNVTGWTEMAIIGNPWTSVNDAPRSDYFNPLLTGYGAGVDVPIDWTPFPNRLIQFFTTPQAVANPQLGGSPLSTEQILDLADTGEIDIKGTTYKLYDPSGTSDILNIPATLCPEIDWQGKFAPFAPSGPRGWLDEYCEWSIEYDADGKMRSVMFTCENPAYFLTMWQINPEAVLSLYQLYIDPAVKLEDLYLRYTDDQPNGAKKGDPVVDATTGRPAYDTVNKWNYGTKRVPGKSGGAMHLTSGPNTLSAEIYLAAAATINRGAQKNQQELICCAQYGQPYRNSDPHIGKLANNVALRTQISLTDPIGLYIQNPVDFTNWKGPNNEDIGKYWNITRGHTKQGDEVTDQILQVVFAIPEDAGFALNDCTINGKPLTHAGVIAENFKIALSATGNGVAHTEGEKGCVKTRANHVQPAPVQMLPIDLFYGQSPSDLPGRLVPGKTHKFALVVQGASKDTSVDNARIQFDSDSITVKVVEYLKNGTPTPGKTDAGDTQAFIIDVTVADNAKSGLVKLRVLNPSEPKNPSTDDHPWAAGLGAIDAS